MACQTTHSTYRTFNEAYKACSAAPECKMFYDVCGSGTHHKLCNGSLATKKDSFCGAITYVKQGKESCFDF